MDNQKFLILYHWANKNSPCLDGYAAAWVAYKHLLEVGASKENIETLGVAYGSPIPDLTGKDVYILDFSYDPDDLIEAAKAASSVFLVDHHESMNKKWKKQEELGKVQRDRFVQGTPNNTEATVWKVDNVLAYHFKSMSGAVAAWHCFSIPAKQCFNFDQHVPYLLQLCQDHDLHNKKFKETAAVVATLYTKIKTMSFEEFGSLVNTIEDEMNVNGVSPTLEDLIAEGEVIARYQNHLADGIIERNVFYRKVAEHYVPICYAPRELRTLIGGKLSIGHPFSLTYEDNIPEGQREYSFRSDKSSDTSVDVEVIATSLGGGGHPSAAGVVVSLSINEGKLW